MLSGPFLSGRRLPSARAAAAPQGSHTVPICALICILEAHVCNMPERAWRANTLSLSLCLSLRLCSWVSLRKELKGWTQPQANCPRFNRQHLRLGLYRVKTRESKIEGGNLAVWEGVRPSGTGEAEAAKARRLSAVRTIPRATGGKRGTDSSSSSFLMSPQQFVRKMCHTGFKSEISYFQIAELKASNRPDLWTGRHQRVWVKCLRSFWGKALRNVVNNSPLGMNRGLSFIQHHL